LGHEHEERFHAHDDPALGYTHLAVPRLSGLAMPGAVFLSSGTARTGSDVRLFLTGVAIISLGGLASAVAYIVTWFLSTLLPGLPLPALLLHVALPGEMPHYALWQAGLQVLVFVCFLLVLRASPLAGYHAAEHMTVACIETYGDVVEEWVRRMPRAHKRCGTNLLAGVIPAMLVGLPLLSYNLMAAGAVAVLGWAYRMQIGYVIQQYFTTKPPSDKQLAAGIAAGRRIMHLWRTNPDPPLTSLQRIWYRGFVQMLAGALAGSWLIGFLFDHLHIWLDW
jgi:hypothetical protein